MKEIRPANPADRVLELLDVGIQRTTEPALPVRPGCWRCLKVLAGPDDELGLCADCRAVLRGDPPPRSAAVPRATVYVAPLGTNGPWRPVGHLVEFHAIEADQRMTVGRVAEIFEVDPEDLEAFVAAMATVADMARQIREELVARFALLGELLAPMAEALAAAGPDVDLEVDTTP